mmetsp:Transcript_10339/g.20881  ORF Transcript_10339/g.20881 Transcript_10339/m.20881 type:complete len:213 (-) Transcript_10339:322-960(-)
MQRDVVDHHCLVLRARLRQPEMPHLRVVVPSDCEEVHAKGGEEVSSEYVVPNEGVRVVAGLDVDVRHGELGVYRRNGAVRRVVVVRVPAVVRVLGEAVVVVNVEVLPVIVHGAQHKQPVHGTAGEDLKAGVVELRRHQGVEAAGHHVVHVGDVDGVQGPGEGVCVGGLGYCHHRVEVHSGREHLGEEASLSVAFSRDNQAVSQEAEGCNRGV